MITQEALSAGPLFVFSLYVTCRLENCLETDPDLQTVLLPPPEGILDKNQAYMTARILHSLGAGLEVRVIGSNVLSSRHGHCRVFWSAYKDEQSGPPKELSKFEPQPIFSLDDFMSGEISK